MSMFIHGVFYDQHAGGDVRQSGRWRRRRTVRHMHHACSLHVDSKIRLVFR